jgi:hypothetical protein
MADKDKTYTYKDQFFNFKTKNNPLNIPKNKPLFGGGVFDPHMNIGGGKLRAKVGKNYFGLTFDKKF